MAPFPPRVKLEVWKRDNGDCLSGLCFVCNRHLEFVEAEIGHIKARANGGSDDLNNLKAICSSCNRSMGTQDMFVYKKKYFSAGSSRSSIDLLTNDLSEMNIKKKDQNKVIEEKRQRLVQNELRIRQNKIKISERQIELSNNKIDEMKKNIQNEENKIAEHEANILNLRTPFCDKMVKNKLCLAPNCSLHKDEPLIDLSEPDKKNCEYIKKDGKKCLGSPRSNSNYYSLHPEGRPLTKAKQILHKNTIPSDYSDSDSDVESSDETSSKEYSDSAIEILTAFLSNVQKVHFNKRIDDFKTELKRIEELSRKPGFKSMVHNRKMENKYDVTTRLHAEIKELEKDGYDFSKFNFRLLL